MSAQRAKGGLGELVRARLEQVRTRLGAGYGVDAEYAMSDAGDVIMVDGQVGASRAGEALRQMQTGLDGLRAGDAALAADFVCARGAALAAALADPMRSSATADRLEAAVANTCRSTPVRRRRRRSRQRHSAPRAR